MVQLTPVHCISFLLKPCNPVASNNIFKTIEISLLLKLNKNMPIKWLLPFIKLMNYEYIETKFLSKNFQVDIFQVQGNFPAYNDLAKIKQRYRTKLGVIPVPDASFWVIIQNSQNKNLIASVAVERLNKMGVSSIPLIFYRYPKDERIVNSAFKEIQIKMETAGEAGTLTIFSNDFDECCSIASLLFYRCAVILKEQMSCDTIVCVVHVGVRKIMDNLGIKYKYLPQKYRINLSKDKLLCRLTDELSMKHKDALSWITNYIDNKHCNIKTIAIDIKGMIETLKVYQ